MKTVKIDRADSAMKSCYPINLKIEGKKVLVVGGGEVAFRKIKTLLSFNAEVHVVSPRAIPEIKALAGKGLIVFHSREYDRTFLEGMLLVISTTDNQKVNQMVARDAQAAGLPVNVADCPELCTFLVPAVVRRGPLTISISTGGKSPAVSAQIRRELENLYPEEYGTLLMYLGALRNRLLKEIPDAQKRREIFIKLSDPSLVKLIRGKDLTLLEEKINELLKEIIK